MRVRRAGCDKVVRCQSVKCREKCGDALYLFAVAEFLVLKCFCAQLKGCPKSEAKEEVDRMISVLRLENKRKTAAKDLSGGMKRKLCVGIALIAGSKVEIVYQTY